MVSARKMPEKYFVWPISYCNGWWI